MAGTLTATITLGLNSTAALSGSGALTTTTGLLAAFSAAATGDGSMDLSVSPGYAPAAALTGAGALTATVVKGILSKPVAANFSGSGVLREPGRVLFDAASPGVTNWGAARTANVPISLSDTHTAAGGATCVAIAHVNWSFTGSMAIVTDRGCTYGGVPMISLGYQEDATDSRHGTEAFYLYDPPTGAKTVSATATSSAAGNCNSALRVLSYTDAAGAPTMYIEQANNVTSQQVYVSGAASYSEITSCNQQMWQTSTLAFTGGTARGARIDTGACNMVTADVPGGSYFVTATMSPAARGLVSVVLIRPA